MADNVPQLESCWVVKQYLIFLTPKSSTFIRRHFKVYIQINIAQKFRKKRLVLFWAQKVRLLILDFSVSMKYLLNWHLTNLIEVIFIMS